MTHLQKQFRQKSLMKPLGKLFFAMVGNWCISTQKLNEIVFITLHLLLQRITLFSFHRNNMVFISDNKEWLEVNYSLRQHFVEVYNVKHVRNSHNPIFLMDIIVVNCI